MEYEQQIKRTVQIHIVREQPYAVHIRVVKYLYEENVKAFFVTFDLYEKGLEYSPFS